MISKQLNKAMSWIVGIISPWYGRLFDLYRRAFWLVVLLISYFSRKKAKVLASLWFDRLEVKIRRKHKEQPETLLHGDRQPEDNLPLTLAVIGRSRKVVNESVYSLRVLAWAYLKGESVITKRGLRWS